MAQISRSALVPYSPEQMYRLVDNISEYPQFLPWCGQAQEYERNAEMVKASVEIAKGAITKSFTTLNRLQPHHSIEMSLVDGPFKHLHGFWRFTPLDTACKVSFDLEFEFSNKIVAFAIGPIFNQVANTLVDSFVKRAHETYGKS